MAFRGRGRGRGSAFGGRFSGGPPAKEEPFILFPEDVVLPETRDVVKDASLINRKLKLEKYWKLSPYFLEEKVSKSNSQAAEIERYSDKNKPNIQIKRDPLLHFIKLTPFYIPRELLEGAKMEHRDKKKLRWDPESEKMDFFEKLEKKLEGRERKDEKAKKEDENDDEHVASEEEEEEESDDGDYNQNFDFDDDEDDLNMADDDDGPVYDNDD